MAEILERALRQAVGIEKKAARKEKLDENDSGKELEAWGDAPYASGLDPYQYGHSPDEGDDIAVSTRLELDMLLAVRAGRALRN